VTSPHVLARDGTTLMKSEGEELACAPYPKPCAHMCWVESALGFDPQRLHINEMVSCFPDFKTLTLPFPDFTPMALELILSFLATHLLCFP